LTRNHIFNAITTGIMASLALLLWRSYRREAAARKSVESQARALSTAQDERVAARTRELAALYDVSAVASQAIDLNSLLSKSLNRTLSAMLSPAGAVYLLDRPSPAHPLSLRLAASQGIPQAYARDITTLSASEGALGWVIEQREPLLIRDMAGCMDLPAVMRQLDGEPLSLLSAPMQASGLILGLIALVRPTQHSFTLEEIALLSSLADQIGQAVENDALRTRAEQLLLLQERQNMSRDLHDSVTQSLYGLVALSEAGQAQLEAGDAVRASHSFLRIGQTARQALREMRLFIHQLRPLELEKEGLIAALHARLAAVEGRGSIQARFLADDNIRLSLPMEEALYHIAQEALNNSMKHAHSDRVTVYLGREERSAVLEIIDEGCGFDLAEIQAGGIGLKSMAERAYKIGGRLRISSIPGSGTRVKVTIPEVL
jgi:signal transduction histidine kinase